MGGASTSSCSAGGIARDMTHLVRVSSGEIIELPEGENSVGRGPLLQVRTIILEHTTHHCTVLIFCVGEGQARIKEPCTAMSEFWKAFHLPGEYNQDHEV